MSFVGLLTILFIALKLTKVIAWSWLWVLSPIWIALSVVLVALIVIGLYMILSIHDSKNTNDHLKNLLQTIRKKRNDN